MESTILRHTDSPFGTFGYHFLENDAGAKLSLTTAEDDWLENVAGSCIPAGRYRCVPTIFHHGKPVPYPTYEITGVPNRSLIKFHIGNTEEDVLGCVTHGLDYAALTVADEDDPAHAVRLKWSISGAKIAHQRFMEFMQGVPEFWTDIRWAEPGECRQMIAAMGG